MISTQQKAFPASPRATFAALLWCLLLLALHVVLGGAACTYGDSPVCVQNDQKDFLYRGALVGTGAKRLPDTRFSVRFASRLSNPPISGFVTDSHGRFCIRWAEEDGGPRFYVGNELVATIPENLFFPPKISGPSPPGCQSSDAAIPWYHTSDPTGTPAFLSVTVLGLLSAGLLLAGLLLGARLVGARLRVAGVGLTLATTAIAAFVWFVLPGLS